MELNAHLKVNQYSTKACHDSVFTSVALTIVHTTVRSKLIWFAV